MLRVTVLAILAPMLGLAACTSTSSGCTGAAIDYAASTTGASSAQAALNAFLAHAPSHLPRDGWRVSSSGPDLTKFRSGAASVEASRFNGGWNITGYRTC